MIITEILARNARIYCSEVALVERSPAENLRRQITWSEFDRQSDRVANALAGLAIGKAGFDWETRIVDEALTPVKQGAVGELIIRGPGVMKEYYKNPEATAAVLKDGWLLTGDMAREDEEGFIWLVDRKKDIIITGGENIYPVDVEEFLFTHPKIHDAAVIGLPSLRLGEIAAAIIQPKEGQTLTKEELVAFCEQLPRYKRPRKFFFDKIPRNPTGKIEKPKLRQKYGGAEESFQVK